MTETEFEEDWRIIRRNTADRIPRTMNVGEALSRLSTAIATLFRVEEDVDQRFHLAIEHEYRMEPGLVFRVQIRGFKSTENVEMFKALNNQTFSTTLEEALEITFRGVSQLLARFNEERRAQVETNIEEVRAQQENLRKLERNLVEMGHYDPHQLPLPL